MDRIGGICGVPGGYDSGEKLIEVWEERKLESKNVCCRKKKRRLKEKDKKTKKYRKKRLRPPVDLVGND